MDKNSWKFKSQSVIGRVIQKPDAQINATGKKGRGSGREKSQKRIRVEAQCVCLSGQQLHMINPHTLLEEQNAKSCCEYAEYGF